MSNILIFSICTVLFLYLLFVLKYELHMMQLNSYYNTRYLTWLKRNFLFRLGAIFKLFKQKEKKKLDFTPRAIRLYVMEIVLPAIVVATLFFSTVNLWFAVLALVFFILFSFVVILLANTCMIPIEKTINQWYINDAKQKIGLHTGLIKIAITGSYGKTSVKHFLEAILSEKYHVLITPNSYNTPLGVVRTIREQLQPIHEVFIAEMGAKKRGDIREICNIVNPGYGILTAAGAQHLEFFGSLENIKQTKLEVITALPATGVGFVNFDNITSQDIPQTTKAKICSFAVDSEADYTAKNITFKNKGMSFEVYHDMEKVLTLETKLLGAHNVSNLLACCGIALHLKVEKYQIENAVKHIEPVSHRLEVKKLPNGITIIDDAFNSNPVGAKMALDVLKRFEGNKKIIITPGMIELGNSAYELNFEFGQMVATHTDRAILVGIKQTKPLQDGLIASGYAADNLFVCKNLNEANEQLMRIVQTGDVVLYENDLPDNYNE